MGCPWGVGISIGAMTVVMQGGLLRSVPRRLVVGESDEMAINVELAGPAHVISGGTREAAHKSRVAQRRQHVIRLVALAASARLAFNRSSVHGLIVVAVALAAAARLAREGGNPLDRYLALALSFHRGLGAGRRA